MFVPVVDSDFVWSQVMDTVDNHFRVQSEQRVQMIGDVPIEGRIDTFPTDASTMLEPWRKDSSHGYEKLHATLQSIRRLATVRVTPAGGGYLIDVAVYKELEDVDRPEHATVGSVYAGRDGVARRPDGGPEDGPLTLGWIRIGRDMTLEQRMLREIHERLTGVAEGAAM